MTFVIRFIVSRIESQVYGGPQLSQLSRQNQKLQGRNKNITAKPQTSRQKQKPHGKTKYFIAKTKYLTKKANTHGKTKAILLLLWSIWFCREVFCFCREVFGFAVTVVGHYTSASIMQFDKLYTDVILFFFSFLWIISECEARERGTPLRWRSINPPRFLGV